MAVKLVFVHAISSVHAGTGQGVGTIDLPIARERATNLPLIPGSTIKGCLKDALDLSEDHRDRAFGTKDSAGRLQISDARLLLLPVRCLGASFVWTTSPYVLRRFARDIEAAGLAGSPPKLPSLDQDGTALLSSPDALITMRDEKRLVLEDLDLKPSVEGAAPWSDWLAGVLFPSDEGWRKEFKKRFAIVDDKSFHFLASYATEVNAHISIDEKGTVEHGALWYQESLPAETVLVSLFRSETRGGQHADDAFAAVVRSPFLQVGGKATTGQGLVRLVVAGG